jgi:hypothetical protein
VLIEAEFFNRYAFLLRSRASTNRIYNILTFSSLRKLGRNFARPKTRTAGLEISRSNQTFARRATISAEFRRIHGVAPCQRIEGGGPSGTPLSVLIAQLFRHPHEVC